ncbi:hypothetical protein DL96DRAFT_1595994 [Flagelloscypha sp. PMI_526]|nr:hypothetical protein DL96DRAFT_1595994 [Flagelloscypha sp. PMI_526]
MSMSDASPRLILARNYVHAIAWRRTVRKQSNIEKILLHFPNLVQICFWRNIFPRQPNLSAPRNECDEIPQTHPSLRRVSTCIFSERHVPRNTFGSPFWMAVTHLQLRYFLPMSSPDSPFQSPLLVDMPSLTHLALPAKGGSSEIDTNLALSRVRDSFPQSLILCLLALREPLDTHGEDWVMEMANAGLKVDRRIVIWSESCQVHSSDMVVTHDDNFQEWCGLHDGVQTLWDKGEAILKRRDLRIEAV